MGKKAVSVPPSPLNFPEKGLTIGMVVNTVFEVRMQFFARGDRHAHS